MRSGYQMRKWQASERRGAQPCPKCSHRIDSHRGMPGECIEDPACGCVIGFDELEQWRRDGRLMR